MDELNSLSNAEKVQVVMNTIGMLDLKPTKENVNWLTGIYNVLEEVRDALAAPLKEEDEDDDRADYAQ